MVDARVRSLGLDRDALGMGDSVIELGRPDVDGPT